MTPGAGRNPSIKTPFPLDFFVEVLIVALARLQSLVRVLLFYFTALVLLVLTSGPLLHIFGLPGHSLMEFLVFAGLPVTFALLVERKPLKPFLRLNMLGIKGLLKSIFLGFVCWFMAQMMGSVAVLSLKQLGGEMVQPYDFLFKAPSWMAFVAGAVVPAICEELSFRGYVLGALRPYRPAVAAVVTGLLFGAMHLSLVRLIPLSLLGIYWAMTVQRSGSVLPGMIMHLINNGVAVGLTFFVQGRSNPADLEKSVEALNALPAPLVWVAIAIVAMMSLGFAVAAYFIAASFNPSDLARPENFEASEALTPQPEPDRLLFADPESVPAEVRALAAELATLRRRRARLLQFTAWVAGALCLALFVFASWQEIDRVFH
jgi:membrane protease YdiL (CAAX protease family)